MYTLRRQSAEFFNVKAHGAYSKHFALKGYSKLHREVEMWIEISVTFTRHMWLWDTCLSYSYFSNSYLVVRFLSMPSKFFLSDLNLTSKCSIFIWSNFTLDVVAIGTPILEWVREEKNARVKKRRGATRIKTRSILTLFFYSVACFYPRSLCKSESCPRRDVNWRRVNLRRSALRWCNGIIILLYFIRRN